MKSVRNQAGSSALGVILILLVVTVVSLVLVKVYRAQQSSVATEPSEVSSKIPLAPEITKAQDLDSAEMVLDQINPEVSSDDSTQLDQQLTTF